MISRRDFLAGAVAAPLAARVFPAWRTRAELTPKERIARVLGGRDVDRAPFSVWQSRVDPVEFCRRVRPDLLKVMNEFTFPRTPGGLSSLHEETNPFPGQVLALERIRAAVGADTYFVDTMPNPWHVAESLSSRAEMMRLKDERPQQVFDALEVIAKSEANHARRALAAGASGIFLGVSAAQDGVLSAADYRRFCEPFDRMVFDAAKSAPLNVLHLHTDAALGDHLHLEVLDRRWPVAVVNYSNVSTGLSVETIRARFDGVIMTGLDERRFTSLSADMMRAQRAAASPAGTRFILAPGCTIPDDTPDAVLQRLAAVVTAG